MDEIKSNHRVSGRVPLIYQIISKLEKQDKEDLLNALNDPTIPTPSICTALEKRGHRISKGSINQYRRGELIHVIG
jgi:tagatose-1,6-bisphosphate aldolase non-catalytic subunit AgaZ/GatZ